MTRNGLDWSARMPALAKALTALPVESAWLDGEVVMPGAAGVPDFAALQSAFEKRSADQLVLYLFDLMYLDGVDWRSRPLVERRDRLAKLLREAPSLSTVRMSGTFDASPENLLESARRAGIEGVMGKQMQSRYVSGRSSAWIKLKARQSDELLIAGFTEGQGSRARQGDIGALVLAAHDAQGALRHAGNVGSGFNADSLAMLKHRLKPLRRQRSPLAENEHVPKSVHWVEPILLAQIAHAGVTAQGRLRHPVYLGLREDKAPSDTFFPPATMPDITTPTTIEGQKITHPALCVGRATCG